MKEILDWFANTRRKLKHQTSGVPTASSTSRVPCYGSASTPAIACTLSTYEPPPAVEEPVARGRARQLHCHRASHVRSAKGLDGPRPGPRPFRYPQAPPGEVFEVAPSSSSVDISQSSKGSCSSVNSYSSHGSCDSRNCFAKALKRRRSPQQKVQRTPAAGKVPLRQISQPSQCNFCTERNTTGRGKKFHVTYRPRNESSSQMALSWGLSTTNRPVCTVGL